MRNKTKLAVEYRQTDSLEPFARNSRTHSERQVEQIAASIKEFGFTNPILVDGVGVIAGHGRLAAAKLLGLAEVPVIELTGLTAAQKRAYVIADNKLALNAGWDDAILSDELKALGAEGFDLALTGFDDVEFIAFLSSGAVDETDMPALPHGDKSPFQQVTFTLHDEQAAIVAEALAAAKAKGVFGETQNANGNGNALARICQHYMADHAIG